MNAYVIFGWKVYTPLVIWCPLDIIHHLIWMLCKGDYLNPYRLTLMFVVWTIWGISILYNYQKIKENNETQ